MAEDIQLWSPTAANNGTADPAINWAEGQARASVNNSSRSMMAAHAKDRNLKNGSIVTSGTASAQTILSGMSYGTLADVPTGLEMLVKIGPSLTSVAGTATTLNVDGTGAVGLKTQRGDDVKSGLVAGAYAHILYNGTNYILLDAGVNITNTLITQVTITNVLDGGTPVAFLDFTGLDTTLYHYYQIIGTDITLETNDALIMLSASDDNGTTFPLSGSDYTSAEYWITESEPALYAWSQYGNGFLWVSWYFDTTAPARKFPITLRLEMFDFQPNACPSFHWLTSHYHQSTWFTTMVEGNGQLTAPTACNAIRLWPTEGNFTGGTFTLYGVPR